MCEMLGAFLNQFLNLFQRVSNCTPSGPVNPWNWTAVKEDVGIVLGFLGLGVFARVKPRRKQ
jgi:hypothetical protein